MDALTTPNPIPTLRRRNSIATSVVVPAKLTLPTKPHHTSSFPPPAAAAATTSSGSSSSSSQSFSTVDFELISLKPSSYTSLKDLLPSTAVQSPTASPVPGGGAQSGYKISIRNRLVKQAAWAYLQPMSTSPDSVGRNCFHRLWIRFSGDGVKNPVAGFFRFIDRHVIRAIIRAVDRLLRAIRVRSSR